MIASVLDYRSVTIAAQAQAEGFPVSRCKECGRAVLHSKDETLSRCLGCDPRERCRRCTRQDCYRCDRLSASPAKAAAPRVTRAVAKRSKCEGCSQRFHSVMQFRFCPECRARRARRKVA